MFAAGQAAASPAYVPRMERVAACSWDRPGHNPFMGDVVAAVDRYTDIPTAVRVRLKQRMQARQYDDFVDIRRDSISGRVAYEPGIRDMHFGLDQVCRQVTRERWTAQTHERGVVYCEQDHCILVPTVCRNVSRIERRPALVAGDPSREAAPPEVAGSLPPTTPSTPSTPSGPSDSSSERVAAAAPAALGPEITSSFAEAVAGATLPLWPIGSDDGDPPRGPGVGPVPWWSTPIGGGSPFAPGAPGAPGGDGGPGDGPGGNAGGGGSGLGPGPGPGGPGSGLDSGGGGGGGGGVPGSGDGTPGGATPPVSPIPEPATWASLLAGLVLLALVSARRRRPR